MSKVWAKTKNWKVICCVISRFFSSSPSLFTEKMLMTGNKKKEKEKKRKEKEKK